MTGHDDKSTPALFGHCVNTYEAMLAEAKKVPFDGGQSEGMVYEGFLTALFRDKLNLSVPYFTSVTQALKRMGCIKQLRRGGSSTRSQWLLITDPTLELYDEKVAGNESHVQYLTEEDGVRLTRSISDLNRRINQLEKMMGL
jgi:hypothetical protein